MRFWPVPHSAFSDLPKDGQHGSFWEDRIDRHHAGIDIYAASGCDVVAVESGTVMSVGVFTTPETRPYWNTTYSIVIEGDSGLFMRYAELANVLVMNNDRVAAGQCIGQVGLVLNKDKINESSPVYIQELKKADLPSMLHFELYRSMPGDGPDYLGGNYFTENKPDGLLDPATILRPLMLSRSSFS